MIASQEQAVFHIVGIGASAGGLEALEDFFDNMMPDSGLAFVVIQHLSPDFKSLMDELLSRHTQIAIHRVEDGMTVEPNSIYLIPPKKEMIISGGKLLLTDKDPSEGLSLPIDTFFRSLAQDAGERAVAIVLSGTGSDGSRGIRAINEDGGLVIVQDTDTAKFDGMPRAAMDSGVVDLVVSPQEMPAALLRHIRHPSAGVAAEEKALPEDAMNSVFRLLRDEYGIDFSHYKPSTVSRRVERRLQLNQSVDLDEYVALLQTDADELNSLYRDLLIGVTKFFRDREAFDRLEDDVIPEMLNKLSGGEELRVWIAGCATGEEAYSVAMLIHERLAMLQRAVDVKVFATDVHRASLDFASMGVYPEACLSEVSPSRLSRYFTKHGSGWQVSADLRKMIVFAPHNIIKDAPFTRLDLITCRNLLIYLQPLAQKKALSLFHFGLKSGGHLFLGSSESPGELSDEFASVDGHWRIYRKRRDVRLPADMRLPLSTGYSVPRTTGITPVATAQGAIDISLLQAYDVLLGNHVPPSLLINDRRELVQTFSGAGKYLSTPDGRQSSDVLDRLEKDVRVSVAGALQRAAKTQTQVVYSCLPANTDDGELKITVTPIPDRTTGTTFSLVTLEQQHRAPVGEKGVEAPVGVTEASSERIQTLESDLRYTRENLQATIEEMETTNEELQATNQELVASNEELQSTNEELHSVNEELYTVNAEHQRKIRELTVLTDDMNNLFRSTDVGTIFLDRDLCIRKFTPKISETFQILPQDIGRRIEGFAHNLVHENLFDDVAQVLKTEKPIEREVCDRHDKWFLMRLLPYRSEAGVDGVVLSLIDISRLKETEGELRDNIEKRKSAEAEARKHARRREEFLAMLSHELRNPMGALLTATRVMDRVLPDDLGAEPRQVVKRQAKQMARLLDDLLDVSRVTQGKIEIRSEVVDLGSLVDDALAVIQPVIDTRQHELKIELPDDPLCVEGDPTRLLQVMENLLMNAAKYTPSGGHIGLSIRRNGQHAEICIRDDGVGIPSEMLDHIFDLFVQSDNAKTGSGGGMGVGLTLVKHLVELQGGTVTGKSGGRKKGSEFTVRLPLTDKRPEPAAESKPQRASESCSSIVLVEDNNDARHMLRQLLELDGYQVDEADNGRTGLETILSQKSDVAIVDIGLPELDGFEVAREVRKSVTSDQVYLVALTGFGQESDHEKVLAAGFDEHLVKPVNLTDLARVMTRPRNPK